MAAMRSYTDEEGVARIDLIRGDGVGSALEGDGLAPGGAPALRMSMDRLRRNYSSILRGKAIYYPVAYQFLRRLGKGRQGEVFLGLRQGARGCITEHAIKVMNPQIYRSPEEYWTDMGRIASQISQLQRVQSPYLVSSHAYEETYGIGYVEMEAIDGVDLGFVLDRKHLRLAMKRSTPAEWSKFTGVLFRLEGERMRFQPGLAVYVVRGVLRGLERLHANNFLHSDVKPANVMMDRLGYIKLVDFGRAVVVGEKMSFLLGSPLYMAPEIHRRQEGGPTSDLYSVGLLTLELLRGQRLLPDGPVDEEKLLQAKLNLPERLEELLPPDVRVNHQLTAILRRLVDPDPAKRFPTAAEAEAGQTGLGLIEKQLVQAGLDAEYDRDLSAYFAKFVDPKTQRVELDGETPVDES
jgi:serine/threonine-protein kinase